MISKRMISKRDEVRFWWRLEDRVPFPPLPRVVLSGRSLGLLGLSLGLLVLSLSLSGCAPASSQKGASAPPREERESAAPEPAPSEADSTEAGLRRTVAWRAALQGTFFLRTQGLVVTLPTPEEWVSLGTRGTFTGLSHPPTGSELWVFHGQARRTVSKKECEQESRRAFTLLREKNERGPESEFMAPAGYGGHLYVLLEPGGGGRVEAFSVGVSRCFAGVFVTPAGTGSGERLSVAAEMIFPSVRSPSLDEQARSTRQPTP